LPPQWRADRKGLASLIGLLTAKRHHAFEFRDPPWYERQIIIDVLRNSGIWLCISDHHDAPAPWLVTAMHMYVRGHGPAGDYKDRYAKRTLQRWNKYIQEWIDGQLHVFCYFDNDQKSAAPQDALRLWRCSLLAANCRRLVECVGRPSRRQK
jgi:uncharacterized protein YecE (DUF72 family)